MYGLALCGVLNRTVGRLLESPGGNVGVGNARSIIFSEAQRRPLIDPRRQTRPADPAQSHNFLTVDGQSGGYISGQGGERLPRRTASFQPQHEREEP